MGGKGKDIRPLGVSILGYLYFLGGLTFLILAFTMSLGFLDESFLTEYIPEIESMMGLLIGGLVIGGLALVVIAFLFLNGSRIGYYIVLALQILSLIDDILLTRSGGLGSILISVIIILYLLRPHVKYWFDI